jgi:TolB protein
MRRREFVSGLGALVLETAAVHAAAPTTLGGRLTRLTAPGTGDNRATYSPDGTALLFASKRTGRSQIWIMDHDGGKPRRFHESGANDYGRVAPSPDGTRFSFSSDRSGQNVVYILDTRRGTIMPISDRTAWSFGPSWSSLDRIAYFSRQGGNRLNLWTCLSDGSYRQQVTNRPGESRQPWWSPDGTTLAFSADAGTGRFRLCDGLRLAASAELNDAGFQILLIDLDGSRVRRIEQPEGDNVHPAWSPDGRSIVFTAGRGDGSALWRFDFLA